MGHLPSGLSSGEDGGTFVETDGSQFTGPSKTPGFRTIELNVWATSHLPRKQWNMGCHLECHS